VASVRNKVDVKTDAALRDEAQLRLIFKDGRKLDEYVKHAKGSLENPLTQEDLEWKFIDQSEEAMGIEKCKRIMEKCWKLDEIENISELLALCRTE
jgi:2-methylcitrate dehydratase PrpD